MICLPRDAIWTRIPLTASTEYAELFFEESFLARMLIINADRVSFAAASLGEFLPEIGSGSEPIAEAATSSVHTMMAGNGGGLRGMVGGVAQRRVSVTSSGSGFNHRTPKP